LTQEVTMPAEPTEPAATETETPPGAPVSTAAPASPATSPSNGTGETPEQTIARLDAELKAARAEAGNQRVNAKRAAAEEARQELANTVGRALGIIPDEVLDPAKLQERVNASEAAARQAATELAVFRVAEGLNANAGALLDSRTFLSKVEAIDVTNFDAVAALITEAMAENPLLAKVAPAPAPAPGLRPNPAQGSSAGGGPLGLDAQISAAEAKGDTRLAIRLKSQKLLQSQSQ
jgi:hypothetical protein